MRNDVQMGYTGGQTAMDRELFYLINRGMANPFFDILMPALTHQGYLLGIPLALYTVVAGSRAQGSGGRPFLPLALAAVLIALCTPPLADVLATQIKILVNRPRPCQALEGVRLVISCPKSLSFPSGHAATSFAFALPLFVLTRQFLPAAWRIAPLAVAAAISLSRPYLGVHYPSDVAAGLLLGCCLSLLPCLIVRRAVRRKSP